jgi:hypothetical protein
MNSFGGEARAIGPDYSHVTSRELAFDLVQRGELVALLLFPEMFGGDDRPENVVFVPPFAAEAKMRADGQIWSQAVDAIITEYAVKPTYSAGSFVPIVLTVHAYDPGSFIHIIRIWGEGLNV